MSVFAGTFTLIRLRSGSLQRVYSINMSSHQTFKNISKQILLNSRIKPPLHFSQTKLDWRQRQSRLNQSQHQRITQLVHKTKMQNREQNYKKRMYLHQIIHLLRTEQLNIGSAMNPRKKFSQKSSRSLHCIINKAHQLLEMNLSFIWRI